MSSPPTMCSNVVLPLPDGPTSAIRAFGPISQLLSSSASTDHVPTRRNRLPSPLATTSASAINDPSLAQPDDTVGLAGHGLAVRGQKRRAGRSPPRFEMLNQPVLRLLIDLARGFVGYQDRR